MKTLYSDSINTKIGPLYIYIDKDNSLVKLCFKKNSEKTINNEKKCLPVKLWLTEYFNGNQSKINFNLKLEGTEFQKAVWKLLLKIPWGKTISYKELAEKTGRPKASRAVGNALNANPIPIIIPCHRVIKSDRSMGGYGGGVQIKKELLKHEVIMQEKIINI